MGWEMGGVLLWPRVYTIGMCVRGVDERRERAHASTHDGGRVSVRRRVGSHVGTILLLVPTSQRQGTARSAWQGARAGGRAHLRLAVTSPHLLLYRPTRPRPTDATACIMIRCD